MEGQGAGLSSYTLLYMLKLHGSMEMKNITTFTAKVTAQQSFASSLDGVMNWGGGWGDLGKQAGK